MLGKKSIYRKPVTILATLALLILFNFAVVNNPLFATKVSELFAQTEEVTDMTVEEGIAQQADLVDTMIADSMPAVEEEAEAVVETAQVADEPQVLEQEDTSMNAQFKDGMRKFWLLTHFEPRPSFSMVRIIEIGTVFPLYLKVAETSEYHLPPKKVM